MDQPLKWLADLNDTAWSKLAEAARSGLPVPNGFVVFPRTAEEDIRSAYDELKMREKTHFLVIRGPSHAVLNVLMPDPLIHTLRRLWKESLGAPLFVQRMVHSMWCGSAEWHRKNLWVKANEGLLILEPDTYVFSTTVGRCIRRALEPKQRKLIRYVDGTMRTVERQGERIPLSVEQLKNIADLAGRVQGNMTWAIDDRDTVWLIGLTPL